MFEFFIALFGGAYYGGKLALEKQQRAEFEKWSETCQSIDEKLGKYNQNEIFRTLEDIKQRWVLLETVNEDMVEIFGGSWRSELASCEFIRQTDMRFQPWGIVYHVLLSKHGAIDAIAGRYKLDFMSDFQRKRVIKAGEVIERNIQKVYPELRLLFEPDSTFVGYGKKSKRVFKPQIALGALCWSHHIRDLRPYYRRLW